MERGGQFSSYSELVLSMDGILVSISKETLSGPASSCEYMVVSYIMRQGCLLDNMKKLF